ncbi:MAG: hypothetical protein OEW45_18535 [Deltaproteobacteria bacterium]|nr:hypothetical protein [Deltaproteobacteria bacterium]
MRKIMFLVWLVVFIPEMVSAQEKVDTPVWNVGDKWIFTQGNIEVVGADQNSYTVKFSEDTCIIENMRFEKMVFEKSTLNRIYTLKGDKRIKYTGARKRILNFPLHPGKQWQDTCLQKILTGSRAGITTLDLAETFKIWGWEDVQVQAGKYRVIKLEYKQKNITSGSLSYGSEGWIRYWYSPDVKYFVKCQYEKDLFQGVKDWELTSFTLKK